MRGIGRLLKFLILLGLLGGIGLATYALIAELPAPVNEVIRDLAIPEAN